MATIVTVHGTFASGPDTGEKWWQHSSRFETYLSDLLEADEGEVKFEPFIWSGLNSETSRRSAGHALYSRLSELDTEGEVCSLIGPQPRRLGDCSLLDGKRQAQEQTWQPQTLAHHRHPLYHNPKRAIFVQPPWSMG